jgi:DNA (cytosine-5)-methyltransferase 1
VNHDPEAITMHKINHPHTKHYCESVWDVNPKEITQGKPIALCWFSPDCRHFSKAKGGKPVSPRVRGLAWVALKYASLPNKPRVIVLENVEEFKTWGRLIRVGETYIPDPKYKGRTFQSFVNALKWHGYKVEWKELKACDYGAPTTRKRLFLIARCDGQKIVFPQPTHGKNLKPFRAAHEIIDWTIPVPSIFDRKKPLVHSTCTRIARGVHKFVLDHPQPFIVSIDNQSSGGAVWSGDSPLTTITTEARHALVAPTLIPYYGIKTSTETRGSNTTEPLPTQTTENRFGLCMAFLTKYYGWETGQDVRTPVHTISTNLHFGLVTAFVAKHFGGGTDGKQTPGIDPREPLHTITAQDHHAIVQTHLQQPNPENLEKGLRVAAFLAKYYGTEIGQSVTQPLHTVTTKDRFGLVTLSFAGETYAIVDIGMRMLAPHELAAAQGFPLSYNICPVHNGKPMTKTAQTRMIGNSVCPPVVKAIIEANLLRQSQLLEAAD